MKHIFRLTLLLVLTSPAWGQSYNDGGYAESSALIRAQQEDALMRQQAEMQHQIQQQQIQMEQQQRELRLQQQQMNSYNNASPIERMTGNY